MDQAAQRAVPHSLPDESNNRIRFAGATLPFNQKGCSLISSSKVKEFTSGGGVHLCIAALLSLPIGGDRASPIHTIYANFSTIKVSC